MTLFEALLPPHAVKLYAVRLPAHLPTCLPAPLACSTGLPPPARLSAPPACPPARSPVYPSSLSEEIGRKITLALLSPAYSVTCPHEGSRPLGLLSMSVVTARMTPSVRLSNRDT